MKSKTFVAIFILNNLYKYLAWNFGWPYRLQIDYRLQITDYRLQLIEKKNLI